MFHINPDLEASCHPITVALGSCVGDSKTSGSSSIPKGIDRLENIASASATGRRMAARGFVEGSCVLMVPSLESNFPNSFSSSPNLAAPRALFVIKPVSLQTTKST
jgi:hypothetical protein